MADKPPSSQTADERPIAFLLKDERGDIVEPVTLAIRPEALTRQDPSRVSVQQTLGGAWADSFGAGLASINISGHTGWRRNIGNSPKSRGEDGVDRFIRLREAVFKRWHDERALRIKSGRDPAGVQLIFSDALDRFGCVVAPQAFVLQRSRSRPLLMQYQISMTVLDDRVGFVPGSSLLGSGFSDILRALGLTSLANGIEKIEKYAKDITSFIDKNIGAPVQQFMKTTAALYRRIDSAVRTVESVPASLISVAQNISRAGMNIFRTINLVTSLPQRAKARMMEVSAAYSNIFCLFRNALKRLPQYDDYSSLYGASNCSSTGGGRGLSQYTGVNTFSAIGGKSTAESGINISTAAQESIASLAKSDVVLAPKGETSLVSAVKTINLGLSVTA